MPSQVLPTSVPVFLWLPASACPCDSVCNQDYVSLLGGLLRVWDHLHPCRGRSVTLSPRTRGGAAASPSPRGLRVPPHHGTARPGVGGGPRAAPALGSIAGEEVAQNSRELGRGWYSWRDPWCSPPARREPRLRRRSPATAAPPLYTPCYPTGPAPPRRRSHGDGEWPPRSRNAPHPPRGPDRSAGRRFLPRPGLMTGREAVMSVWAPVGRGRDERCVGGGTPGPRN